MLQSPPSPPWYFPPNDTAAAMTDEDKDTTTEREQQHRLTYVDIADDGGGGCDYAVNNADDSRCYQEDDVTAGTGSAVDLVEWSTPRSSSTNYEKVHNFLHIRMFDALLRRQSPTQLTIGQLVVLLILEAPKFSASERELLRSVCQLDVGDFVHRYAAEITARVSDNVISATDMIGGDGCRNNDQMHLLAETCALLKSRVVMVGGRGSSRPRDDEDEWRDRLPYPQDIRVEPWTARIQSAKRGRMYAIRSDYTEQLVKRARNGSRGLAATASSPVERRLPGLSRYDPEARRMFLTTVPPISDYPSLRRNNGGGTVVVDDKTQTAADAIRVKLLNAYGRWAIVEPRFVAATVVSRQYGSLVARPDGRAKAAAAAAAAARPEERGQRRRKKYRYSLDDNS